MANAHNKDAQCVVLDVCNDSIVADAVLPELAQRGTLKGFPDATRVIDMDEPVLQKGEDAPRYLWVDLP